MKHFTKAAAVITSLFIIAGTAATAPFTVSAATSVKVSKSEISSTGAGKAIQNALDKAKSNATANNPYTVTVEGGSYTLDRMLNIYSNTNLVLTGVTLSRNASIEGTLIHVGANDQDNNTTGKTGYTAYKNIRVTNGTLNGLNRSNTLFKAAHCTNVKLSGTTFRKNYSHFIELAAIDGFTAENCSFSDMETTSSKLNYEAIQVDILHKSHFNSYRMEDLPCKNITIESSSFDNCPRGVGSHTSVNNAPHTNITVNKCKFTNMKSAAIQFQGVQNCKITNNTVDNTPRGIAVYSVLNNGNGCFKSSIMASQGNTKSHYSDSYKTPGNSNIKISGNVIKRCGNVSDKYNKYEFLAIGAFGYDVPSNTSTLNKGNYYLRGVRIIDNVIDVKGHGIRISNTRDIGVDNNIITCSENTAGSDYYGISATESSQVKYVSNNVVKKAHKNGIYIQKGTSCDKIDNNSVSNTGKYGIGLFESTVTDIFGNTVRNIGAEGISLVDSKTSNVYNNAISGITNNGICVNSASNGGIIKNNIVTGCGDSEVRINSSGTRGSVFDNDATKSVRLNKASAIMYTGETLKLEKAVEPSNSMTTFVWSSSNTDVAAVSNGNLTAKNEGTAIITVTTFNGKTASCKIAVYTPAHAPSIKFSSNSCKLGAGEKLKINTTVANTSAAPVWTSSNAGVAEVKDGVITAVDNGTATITAILNERASASCTVTVYNEPEFVNTTPQKLTLGVGETYTISELTSAGSYANAANLKWTSSNGSAVKINKSSGNKAEIMALKIGASNITITLYNGLTASCAVTVMPAPSAVTIPSGNINLGVGEQFTISESTSSGSYANAANLKWTSSNASIAKVTKGSANKATVQGVKVGSANIMITLYNGKKASIKVNVKPAPASVAVNPKSFKLGAGESLTISESTNSGSYANSANIKWTSSDNSIASVTKGSTNKASVRAVSKGSANVSVFLYNGKKASAALTVLPAPKTVKLSASNITLNAGKTYTISENTDSGSYANAANLKWSSSNSSVASVTKSSANKAIIKAVKKGTTKIKITLYNGLSSECTVTVK